MIDLNDMEKKLDEVLSKETKETLTDFVNMKREAFKEGAKWQQERSYIEANKIIEFLDNEAKLKISDTKTIERIKWYFETYFEQFKKKQSENQ